MVIVLCGWCPFWEMNSFWGVLPLLGLNAGQPKKRLVTTHRWQSKTSKKLRKNVKSCVDSTTLLVKYLSLKMNRDKVIFEICLNRAIENV